MELLADHDKEILLPKGKRITGFEIEPPKAVLIKRQLQHREEILALVRILLPYRKADLFALIDLIDLIDIDGIRLI